MCSIKKDYDGQRLSGDTEIKSFRSSQGIELWYLYNIQNHMFVAMDTLLENYFSINLQMHF